MGGQRIAFLFPGQGSQYVGMGQDFFDAYSEVRALFEQADDVLGRDLSRVILKGPEEELTHTRNSQTGIYVVSLAILEVLRKEFPGLQPGVCAGLSLGEYTAVTASGRLTFETGLPLVQARGQYMNDACEAHEGSMAVIMGLPASEVERMVGELDLPDDLWAANFNCPGQVVISGTPKGVEAGMAAAKERGAKRALPLKVHGAFHSGLMVEAQERLAPHVEEAPLVDSAIRLVMNVPGDFVSDLTQMRRNLVEQVTSPVRWEQGIHAMEASGIDLYVEIGCGKSLCGMLKRSKTSGKMVSVEKVEDLERLSTLLTELV